jgi:hypothetical protein
MSYKFSDDDKTASEFAERMPYGISEVQLVGATLGETEAGKEYVEIGVVDKDGIEDSARVWFVGGAAKYSFDTVRSIIVHIAKTDADKEKARQAVEACPDTEALVEILNSKCSGGQLWFTKYYDPERTYTAQDGKTRRSINKQVLGYQPKLKPELMPKDSGDIVLKDLQDVMPGAERLDVPFESPSDAGANVPKGW